MDFYLYYNIIIKRLWIILLLPILGVSISTYYTYSKYEPLYESNTSILIVNAQYDENTPLSYTDMMAAQELAKELSEVVKSRSIVKEVADTLQLSGFSAGNISVSVKNDTRLMTISVVDKNPEMSKRIVEKLTEVFTARVSKISKDTEIVSIDKPEIPVAPIPPDYKKKAIMGALAGLLGAFAIIFLIEEMDDTIKNIEDVEKQLDLKVLGTIPTLDIK